MAMDRFALYKAVIVELGEALLADLNEKRKSRYLLDEVFDTVVLECLEAGQWNFAERTIEFDFDSDVATSFGYRYTFNHPADWVRTTGIGSGPYINDCPLDRYDDDQAHWYADITPIYVRYVSSDPDWGLNYAAWPATFARFVVLANADRICEAASQNAANNARIKKDAKAAKRDAMSKDAMRDASKRPPPGNLVASRFSRNSSRYYRG